MIIKELNLKGVYEITLAANADHRGFFMRTYDKGIFRKYGLDCDWLQENHSHTKLKGTIRGLHFQVSPFSETKLVRCIRGKIFDVVVDIRRDSDSFGEWIGIELSEENKKMLFIPRGFAHGFCTLTDLSEVMYKVDNIYSPGHERGLLWNDPDIAIEWPVTNPILSAKDQKNMTFKSLIEHG